MPELLSINKYSIIITAHSMKNVDSLMLHATRHWANVSDMWRMCMRPTLSAQPSFASKYIYISD